MWQRFSEYEYSSPKIQFAVQDFNNPAIFHIPTLSMLSVNLVTRFLEYSILEIFIFHGIFHWNISWNIPHLKMTLLYGGVKSDRGKMASKIPL